MSIFRRLLKINYRHYICVLITIVFILLAWLCFSDAFKRIVESIRDLGLSLAYYVDELFFEGGRFEPTVTNYSQTPFVPPVELPDNYEDFTNVWDSYWAKWTSLKNLKGYLKFLFKRLYNFCKILLLVIPFIIACMIAFKRHFESENNRYNVDSLPLKVTKTIAKYSYIPIKNWVLNFIEFVRERRAYWVFWCVIWAYSFNFFTIIIEFFAFYFYFVVSLDVLNIYVQVVKLIKDLSVVIKTIPIFGWVLISLLIFLHIRKSIAFAKLNHMERKNRGFINARPIVYMVCGTMGKKKTTTITDMALSQEIMFRDKAFEKILQNDMKFPFFPWINLENELKRAIEFHQVYNLATCGIFANKKRLRFEKCGDIDKIFGYDYERYGTEYSDNLRLINIWEVIENYIKLYFIYIVESSLIISNYSIRTDGRLSDLGNFPMWNNGIFKRDNRLIDAYSRHSHILDYDSLRLGKKLIEDNKFKDSFEFGVISITEIGKERGNNLELIEKKKKDNITNQKNDLFNHWLKMIRHSATVDNFPFVKVLTDEQRPASWGADARELCEIVNIADCGEERLSLPFFVLEELIHDLTYNKFRDLYYQYRFVRADNTLLMHAMKKIMSIIHNHYVRVYNQFGYSNTTVLVESGYQDGVKKRHYYYLMNKKIYSKRFSTDCFSDFFMKKSASSLYGINDLPEYQTEKANMEELLQQNSYFMNDLFSGFNGAGNRPEN